MLLNRRLDLIEALMNWEIYLICLEYGRDKKRKNRREGLKGLRIETEWFNVFYQSFRSKESEVGRK